VQVSLALVTIEESETTKKLAAWAAIFGVCTTGVGIWGMNFKHMPELDWNMVIRYRYLLFLAQPIISTKNSKNLVGYKI
jgi:magnesium transporter